MSGWRNSIRLAMLGARAVAGAIALTRLARAATPSEPLRAVEWRGDERTVRGSVHSLIASVTTGEAMSERSGGRSTRSSPARSAQPSISVVVPARDEVDRIGPLLDLIVGAPGVWEVIVVDDQSTDGTGTLAERAGARVVDGEPLPAGWTGKAWALQQGLLAATTEWVVALDADTRPDPRLPAALVDRAHAEGFDLLSLAGRFECPTRPARWLHAAMLTTLVYRFGPPGTGGTRPDHTMANGQCWTVERESFLARGGMSPVAGEVVEDVALARAMTAAGYRVGFLDGSDLLTVRMFESLGDTWRGWGRSLALPGVEARHRQVLDLAVVVVAQVLPIPKVLAGRGDLIDVVLAIARVGTLLGTRRAYDRTDAAYWLSPLADGPAAVAIGLGIARGGHQTWRGRDYGHYAVSGPP